MPLDVKRWLRDVFIRLPPGLTAYLLSLRSSARKSWGGPFNGQLRRQEMVAQLLRTLPFQAIVETGTYRGETTAFLRRVSSLPVFSVEHNHYFFRIGSRRFRGDPGLPRFECSGHRLARSRKQGLSGGAWSLSLTARSWPR